MKVFGQVAFSYGVSLLRARRLTEEEKAHYTEEYRERGFKPTTDPAELKELDWKDVRKVLNNRNHIRGRRKRAAYA